MRKNRFFFKYEFTILEFYTVIIVSQKCIFVTNFKKNICKFHGLYIWFAFCQLNLLKINKNKLLVDSIIFKMFWMTKNTLQTDKIWDDTILVILQKKI